MICETNLGKNWNDNLIMCTSTLFQRNAVGRTRARLWMRTCIWTGPSLWPHFVRPVQWRKANSVRIDGQKRIVVFNLNKVLTGRPAGTGHQQNSWQVWRCRPMSRPPSRTTESPCCESSPRFRRPPPNLLLLSKQNSWRVAFEEELDRLESAEFFGRP